MGKITFILGGARSGKSRFAVELAKKRGKEAAFIATCEAKDAEMKRRIQVHKRKRPDNWQTFEEPCEVSKILRKAGSRFEVILIDCLTLLVSNLMLKNKKERQIVDQVTKILRALSKHKAGAIIVSNEVGLGIVPQNELARSFRDIAGRVNQLVAKESEEVYFMVSGIPWRIK